MEAHRGATNQNSGTKRDTISNNPLKAIKNATERRGSTASGAFACELGINLALEFLLDGGIERKDFEFTIVTEQGLYEGASQNLASRFYEGHLVLVDWRSFEQGFENGGKIPDGNLFTQQLLEYALNFTESEKP